MQFQGGCSFEEKTDSVRKQAQAMQSHTSHPGKKPVSDGTTELLQWGGSILGAGALAIAALLTVFGGVGVEGAHSNAGWLALVIGAMCLPFGLMLTLLGLAKWLRRRGLDKAGPDKAGNDKAGNIDHRKNRR